MISASNEFIQKVKSGDRKWAHQLVITPPGSSSKLTVTGSDIWGNGVTYSSSTSSETSFDIGGTCIGTSTFVLNNIEEKFSKYVFEGAEVVASIGLSLDSGKKEMIQKGIYIIDSAEYSGGIITLTGYDRMSLFDRPYEEDQKNPNIRAIIVNACVKCGVPFNSVSLTEFPNSEYIPREKPSSDGLTFRQVVSWALQIACSYGKINSYGEFEVCQYDNSIITTDRPLQTSSGATLESDSGVSLSASIEAGSNDYVSGDINGSICKLDIIYSLNVSMKEAEISGIKVVESEGDETTSYLYGSENYTLAIEGNELIKGAGEEVAQLIGQNMVGLTMRAFTCSCGNNPLLEAGDRVLIVDRKNRPYISYATSVNFTTGGAMEVRCDAETQSTNNATRYSGTTRAIAVARAEARKELSGYDDSMKALTNLLTQGFGVFKSEEVQEDGSSVFYLHNKPALNESDIIWKMTADALAVSTDGGKTWNAGIDAQGNAVVNVLSAIGITFDWAKGGTLTLGGDLNVDGVLEILDTKGRLAGRIANNGAEFFDVAGRISTLFNNGGIDFLLDGKKYASMYVNKMKNSEEYGLAFFAENGAIDFRYNTSNANQTPVYTEALQVISNESNTDSSYPVKIPGTSGLKIEGRTCLGNSIKFSDSNGNMLTPTLSISSTGISDSGSFTVSGDLKVSGTKNREIKTQNYSKRLQYSYETASPYFGDIGEGRTDENGECIVDICDIFAETARVDLSYQVFLQKEGPGDIWVSGKTDSYFIVKGTKNLNFAWELKAKQADYEAERLEISEDEEAENNYNYEEEYMKEVIAAFS